MKGEGGGGFYQTDVGKALDIYIHDFQIMGGGGIISLNTYYNYIFPRLITF